MSEGLNEWKENIYWINFEFRNNYQYRKADIDCCYFGWECLCKVLIDSYSGEWMYEKAYNYRDLQDLTPKTIFYGENNEYQCIKDDKIILGPAKYYMDSNEPMYLCDSNRQIKVSNLHQNY